MPIFDFECQECGMIFEHCTILKGWCRKCPKCDSYKIKKLISKANFVLKGSGWAKDGYEKKTSDKNND